MEAAITSSMDRYRRHVGSQTLLRMPSMLETISRRTGTGSKEIKELALQMAAAQLENNPLTYLRELSLASYYLAISERDPRKADAALRTELTKMDDGHTWWHYLAPVVKANWKNKISDVKRA
jgi:predicted Zn-dependent protease